MKKVALLTCLLTALSSCTERSQSVEESRYDPTAAPSSVYFESPISYRYDQTLEDKGVIAQFGDDSIEKHGFNDVEKSLEILNLKIIKEMVYVGAYWAQLDLEKKNLKNSTLKTSFPVSDKVKAGVFGSSPKTKKDINLVSGTSLKRPYKIWVNDRLYTEAEVSLGSLELAKLRNTYFNVQLKSLESAIISRVISKQANRKKLAKSQFVDKHILTEQKVSSKKIQEYALRKNIPKQELNAAMKANIRSLILSEQLQAAKLQYANQFLGNRPVTINFAQPRLKIYPIDTSVSLPTLGSGSLPLTLICNFSDQDCRTAGRNIDHFLSRVHDQIELKYIFRFESDDRKARTSSEASLCVNKLAPDQFWAYSKMLIDSKLEINEPNINKIVKDLRVDFDQFRDCMAKGETRPSLEDHLALTRTLGQVKVPILLVGNHYHEAPLNFELIGQQIKDSLANLASPKR